jgi:hypothetical protein
MEGLDKGGQGPTSGCCAIEEEDVLKEASVLKCFNYRKLGYPSEP